MKVTLEHIGPVAFRATAAAGGEAVIDGKEAIGGEGRGMLPMEALLMALGSCSAMDVLYILRKQKEPIADLRVELESERSETTPKRFTKIHLRFVATGDGLKMKKVERAVSLSVEKYCAVRSSLSSDIEITYEAVPAVADAAE